MQTIQLPYPSSHNPNRDVFTFPKSLGSGNCFIESYYSGLKLIVADMRFSQPLTLRSENNPHRIGMGFVVNGESEGFSKVYKPVRISSGMSGYFTLSESVETNLTIMTKSYQQAWIIMEQGALTKLADEDEESFTPFLQGLKKELFHFKMDKLTPAMCRIAQQICNCPYQGKIASLFLEGKMLELMVLKLEQMKNGQGKTRYSPPLKPQERERVRHAADLLKQQMVNPPDLRTLGLSVGMCRTRFHLCFCQEFGKTPLEYLRAIRLDRSKNLLEQGLCNVSEAALMVGYNNPGYFSRLFRQRYHLLPKDIL